MYLFGKENGAGIFVHLCNEGFATTPEQPLSGTPYSFVVS